MLLRDRVTCKYEHWYRWTVCQSIYDINASIMLYKRRVCVPWDVTTDTHTHTLFMDITGFVCLLGSGRCWCASCVKVNV